MDDRVPLLKIIIIPHLKSYNIYKHNLGIMSIKMWNLDILKVW